MSQIKLPKLPYGEGSMSIMPDGETIIYKKTINKKRQTVYGKTPKECLAKMREKEKEITESAKKITTGSITLGEAIDDWHNNVKKVSLKKRSWDREYHTKENQIKKYPIAHMQMQAISDRDIQKHINTLIEDDYSYSTVKKTYELLNQFFAYYYANNINDNPMNKVTKPTKSAMNVQEKDVEYFDKDDLSKFIKEATRMYSNGKPVYKYGYGLVAMIFCFTRIGETLALRWKDFDFDKNCFYVREAISRVIDEDAETDDNTKHKYKIETTTPKYDSIRTVYMNKDCKKYFQRFKELQNPDDELEWVFATQNKSLVSERNLRRCLNNIQEAAKLKVQNSGFHVLRHTGITLMARAGVDEMVVARIAGQKDLEMIHRVYRHISEHEKIEAINKISKIEDLELE